MCLTYGGVRHIILVKVSEGRSQYRSGHRVFGHATCSVVQLPPPSAYLIFFKVNNPLKIYHRQTKMGLNVIIDGTMNSPKKSVKQIQDFKKAEYFTSCDYMFTPMQESMKRACSRFKTRKNDYSGHFVPLGIMTDMTQNEDAFEAVKGLVDRYSFQDNFNQTNGMATLICQKGDY